jgi:hypothetical protein
MIATAYPGLAENVAPRKTSIRSPAGEVKRFRRSETRSFEFRVSSSRFGDWLVWFILGWYDSTLTLDLKLET